jgi:hypothetical protein
MRPIEPTTPHQRASEPDTTAATGAAKRTWVPTRRRLHHPQSPWRLRLIRLLRRMTGRTAPILTE